MVASSSTMRSVGEDALRELEVVEARRVGLFQVLEDGPAAVTMSMSDRDAQSLDARRRRRLSQMTPFM